MTKRRNRDYASTLPRSLPAEVKRTALLKRMAHAENANLVVLVAPSGYGKTTLLGQVARDSKHAAWLTLSDRHADLKSLTDALMASITQTVKEATFPRIRKAVAEGARVAVLATLFARELDGLAVNIKICIDQTHLLGDDALAWLESFSLALGEGHQLIYCAYDLASERLAAPLASGSALLFTTSDLAFSENESRAYLNARGSSADAFEVQKELEGWPAGVGLAAAGVERVLSHEELLRAAFDRLPEDVREALPEASVLEVWREVDAVQLGCDLPRGWLKEARRAGLPMTPLSTQAYRPHTLVSEILDRELQAQLKRYRHLHNRAAHKAQERRNSLAALHHYKHANQTQKAIRLSETLIPDLLERSEFPLVCQLVELFDRHDLTPALISKYGFALLKSGNFAEAEKVLSQLYTQGLGDDLTFRALSEISSRRGEVARGLELVEEGLASTKREGRDEVWGHLEREKICLLTEAGNLDEALELALYWSSQIESKGDHKGFADILMLLADIYGNSDDYEACEKAILRALSILKDLQLLNVFNAFRLSAQLANLYRIQNRLSDALDIVDNTLAVAKQENSIWVSFLIAIKGDIFTNQVAFAEAVPLYQEAIGLFERSSPINAQYVRYKLSNVARRSGDQSLAQRTLAEARQLKNVHGLFAARGWEDFHEALESLSIGDIVAARQQLRAAEATTASELLLRVYAYSLEIARQERKLGEEQVMAFVKQLDAFGHDATLWIDAEPLRPLYEECVARSWFAERFAPFTKPYLKAINERTRSILSVQTFEDVSAALDGKPIKMPFAKAAELLVWLALYGPASREKIFDALWDGSNDPRHIEYGKLALRRLRTTLAEHVSFNPLVYAERQYRFADELEIKLDVQDVLRAFEKGDDTARREALEHYSAAFLPGVTSEWVEALRAELHDAALATAMGLGASYEHNDLPSALWTYRKAVEIEPLFLDSHRSLVRLLQTGGDQVGARLAYQTYLRVLKTEYGETPDLTFDDMLYKAQPKHLI